jgi:hypothetical protein
MTPTPKLPDDQLREILRAVPQRIVGQMCGGRQTVHLQRFAARWGFPIDGKMVDLFAVLSRLWSFLKQHGPALRVLQEETSSGDILSVQFLKAKIALTREQEVFVRTKRQEKDRSLVDKNLIDQGLAKLASRIRRAGETAQRKFGKEGFELFDDLLNGFGRDVQELKATAEKPVDDDKAARGKKRNPRGAGAVSPTSRGSIFRER